jgi:hypothetical protein
LDFQFFAGDFVKYAAIKRKITDNVHSLIPFHGKSTVKPIICTAALNKMKIIISLFFILHLLWQISCCYLFKLNQTKGFPAAFRLLARNK